MHTKDGMARLQMETTLAVLGDGGRSATNASTFSSRSTMPDNNIAELSDLSRLNWRGWLLLVLTMVAVVATVAFMVMNGGYGDYRQGRKAIGLVVAFACFGAFALIAVIMEKCGCSIYREGMNPFDNIDISIVGKAPESNGPTSRPTNEDENADPMTNKSNEKKF